MIDKATPDYLNKSIDMIPVFITLDIVVEYGTSWTYHLAPGIEYCYSQAMLVMAFP